MTGSPRIHKEREIRFCRLHPDAKQALSAAPVVGGLEGVQNAEPTTEHQLHVGYDLANVTLRTIEETLVTRGYHLDNSLLCKLKRALYYYTEEVERHNLGVCGEANTQIYVNRYQRIRHGCRDDRPEHWRNYL